VRDDQIRFVDDPLAIQQQVEVQRTRGVGDRATAAVATLNLLKPFEQRARRQLGLNLSDGIEIGPLSRRTTDPLSLVERRAAADTDIPLLLQIAEGRPNGSLAVTEV
jgi:hypothetical protein